MQWVRVVIKLITLSRYPLAHKGILFGGPAMEKSLDTRRVEAEVECKTESLEKSRSWNSPLGELGKSAGLLTKVFWGD